MSRSRLRLTAALALALVASASGGAAADPTSGQPIDLTVYAGSASPATQTFTVGQLQSGCPTYQGPSDIEQYEPSGALAPTTTISPGAAWALGTLLGCLMPSVQPSIVTVLNSEGEPETGPDSVLSAADLDGGGDFVNPQEAPVLDDDGDGLIYERPQRPDQSGQFDANATDQFSLNPPAPFELDVFTGPLITVTATASNTSPAAGAPVTFTATVQGSPAGLAYSWNFDGGAANATLQDPTVSFAGSGVYAVSLQVSDAAGGGGGAELQITVGNPPATTTTGSPQGPGDAHGTQPRAPAGNHKAKGNPSAHKRDKPAKTPSHTSTTPRSTSTTPSAPPTGSTGTGARTTPAARPQAPSVTTATTARPPAHHITPERNPASTGPGALVSGRLIGDVIPLPPDASPLVTQAGGEASAPPLRAATGGSLLAGLGAGLVIGLLFGVGAGRELGLQRPRRIRSSP